MVTLTDEEYQELLQAKAERDELRATQALSQRQQLKLLGERALAEEHTRGWARIAFSLGEMLHYAWEALGKLKAKVFHRDSLLSNGKLEAEDRLYLDAAISLAEETSKRDQEGRAKLRREAMQKRAGLSKFACYRSAKRLEAAGIIDAKVYQRHTAGGFKKDRFEKLCDLALYHPESLDIPKPPKEEEAHPRCAECETDDTIVKKVTTTTITCRECGTVTRSEGKPLITINPLYRTSGVSPGKSPCCSLQHGENSGLNDNSSPAVPARSA